MDLPEIAKPKPRPVRADVALPDRLSVSVEEAAGLTGVGRTSIFTAMRKGEIPRIRIGKRTLLKIVDLNAWLTKNAAGGNK